MCFPNSEQMKLDTKGILCVKFQNSDISGLWGDSISIIVIVNEQTGWRTKSDNESSLSETEAKNTYLYKRTCFHRNRPYHDNRYRQDR